MTNSPPEMPPRVRETLFHRIVLGLSRKETAMLMKISPWTVKRYEFTAKEAFGARNWHQLSALVIASGMFSGDTVLVASEEERPPVWKMSKRTID